MKLFMALLFLMVFKAHAFEYGCKIHPSQLEEIGTRTVQNSSGDGKAIPESMPVRDTFLKQKETFHGVQVEHIQATLEGFYRPVDDDFYMLPIPLFGAALSRERNVIYLCAHYDSLHSEFSHITVYMMRGYHLQPTSLSTIAGDLVKQPQLRVLPLNVGFLNVGTVTRKLVPFMKYLAPFNWGVKVIDGLQRIVTNLLGDTFSLGVERITITTNSLEMANGVDLKNPDNAKVLKRIDFNESRNEVSVAPGLQNQN